MFPLLSYTCSRWRTVASLDSLDILTFLLCDSLPEFDLLHFNKDQIENMILFVYVAQI